MNFEKIDKCDLCGSKNSSLFLETPDRNYGSGIFNYLKCKKCDLIWMSPRPTQQSIFKSYPRSYGPYRKLKPINNFQQIVRYLIKNNNFLAKLLIQDPLFFDRKKGKLLDIGTGNGSYLTILKSWGWDAYGIEPDKTVVDGLKKYGFKNIFQGDIFGVDLPRNNFDLIRYSHVLEHVLSPKKEITRAKLLLKKGGKIQISLPNIDSLFFKIFKSYWYPLEAPRHLYQFSPKTITKLLKVLGFKKIIVKYNQSPYTFLWSLSYYFNKQNVDKRVGIITLPLALILKILNLLKKSDVIEVTAIK